MRKKIISGIVFFVICMVGCLVYEMYIHSLAASIGKYHTGEVVRLVAKLSYERLRDEPELEQSTDAHRLTLNTLEVQEKLADAVNVKLFGQANLIHITDRKGNEILPLHQDDVMWQMLLQNFQEKIVRKNADGYLYPEGHTRRVILNAEEYYLSYAPIGIKNWYVMALVPVKVASFYLVQVVRTTIIFLVFLLLLGGIIVWRIISEKLKNEAMVYKLAYEDDVTGLHNRNYFFKKVDKAKTTSSETGWAILVLDINDFKWINTKFNVNTGNLVLAKTAELLEKEFAGEQEVLARMHADKFAILKKCKDLEELENYAKHILGRLQTLEVGNLKLFLRGTIGAACFSGGETEESHLLVDRANEARRNIKDKKETEYALYDEKLLLLQQEENALKEDLISAISQEEFVVYYQPKVNARTGQVVGAEALVRWEHSTRGMVSPARFIPLAEANGLVWQITQIVFERVCADYRRWTDAGIAVPSISINLSVLDIYQEELLPRLQQIMTKYQVPAGTLEAEITETSVMHDLSGAMVVLGELKALGLKIDIDDFGTGYSALSYLQTDLFDVLKLDRSFLLRREHYKEQGEKLIRSIIAMANSLGLHIVCEGAETKEQVEFLQSCGCDIIQGYYFSKPLPEVAFVKLL